MWGKRYNRGSDHGKHWYIWVSCSAANLFCLCSVPEMSLKCHGWQVWESVEAVDFSALSLKSRQIKPYLPQRITLLCIGILRRVSTSGAICGVFSAKSGKLPRERRTALLGRFWPELRTGFRGRFFPPLGGASRAPGCPPSASPSPKGCFGRQPEPTHYNEKGGKYERESKKKSDPEYPPDTG